MTQELSSPEIHFGLCKMEKIVKRRSLIQKRKMGQRPRGIIPTGCWTATLIAGHFGPFCDFSPGIMWLDLDKIATLAKCPKGRRLRFYYSMMNMFWMPTFVAFLSFSGSVLGYNDWTILTQWHPKFSPIPIEFIDFVELAPCQWGFLPDSHTYKLMISYSMIIEIIRWLVSVIPPTSLPSLVPVGP